MRLDTVIGGSRAVRAAALAGSAMIALSAAPATAQTTAPAQPAAEASSDAIVVTGSRIVRRDFEANSPIVTVESETFENISTVAIETALNQLPQFVPALSQFQTMDVQSSATSTPM